MRAVGIVRVSEAKGRAGDSFASPGEQRERIEDACRRDGMELVRVTEEIDVSGGTPLAARDGLRSAVEAVEAGEAEVLVVAYFDRLVRSLTVQDEVVSRVEAAGGRVLAVDFGQVTGRSAAQWLSGTMIGAVSEYYRRSIAERSGEAQAIAVARGVVPWPNVPPGYRRGDDGRLEPDELAPVVAEAFALRADGATIAEVRLHLLGAGIERSYHGVQSLLGSRVVLGEIHFGELVNLSAHEPIVDRGVWEAVQRVRKTRGHRPRSDRLLARLGILRCGTCGGRMSVGMQRQNGRAYPFYRCSPTSDCTRRVTIGAEIVEGLVVEKVQAALRGMEGSASAEEEAREAEAVLERAQADLDAAIRVFGPLDDEPAAVERLAELRAERDAVREAVHELGGLHSALAVSADDWPRLTLAEQRALVRAVVAQVSVGLGKGRSRLSVELRGE